MTRRPGTYRMLAIAAALTIAALAGCDTVSPTDDNVLVIEGYLEAGKPLPRYRDLFPQKPPPGVVPTCAEAGILGALTGVIGSMQALEIIKEITGTGAGLAGRLLMYDSLAARFEEFRYARGEQA